MTDVAQAMVVLEAAEKEYQIFRGNGLSEPMSGACGESVVWATAFGGFV